MKVQINKTKKHLTCSVCGCQDFAHSELSLNRTSSDFGTISEKFDSVTCWDCGNTYLLKREFSIDLDDWKYELHSC